MLRILCPAKVNLFLAIGPRDPSGYHLLDTIFLRTRLFQDELTLERADETSFHCDSLPAEGNSVLKALQVLEQTTGRHFNYRITLKKGIPVGSGLGGASSDAAALLQKLNELENLKLSQTQLMELGAQVGMDVPFFLSGYSAAHGTHFGEQVTLLPSLPANLELRIEPGLTPISTQEAFERWDMAGLTSTASSEALRTALHAQDPAAILAALHNDFGQFFTPPKLTPGEAAVLTGSGSAFAVLHML
jgi:4-diphosphocytidyl-2-C-methyl-D-erythritol kinase